MNLTAIDIGTNSIHMIIVKATSQQNFEVLVQEKEMVKLGVGVFANKILSKTAYHKGLETISRYVQLADQYGTEHIITAATSATREAKNGREFLDNLIHEVGISPQLISGNEEARLIFLAVRRAIDLQNEKVLVLDIGGGSTEAVIGNKDAVLFKTSMKLGVLRLLDRVGSQEPLNQEQRNELKNHVREIASSVLENAKRVGFDRVVGTSGTIRALGEATLLLMGRELGNTVNAEVIKVKDLEKVVDKLMSLAPDRRTEVKGISENRVDAIHLGGLLLVELLKLAEVKEITLSDASLREGLIIDFLEKHGQMLEEPLKGGNIKERSCLQMAKRYETDIEEKKHVSMLALQLFDQLKDLHELDKSARDLLYQATLVHDVGTFVNFQNYHKHSQYLILQGRLRGFNNLELKLLSLLARYHRKAGPKKRHKEYKQLDKKERRLVKGLAGILRIAVGFDKTKNQWVENVHCVAEKNRLIIKVFGETGLELEIWESQRFSDTLSKYLNKDILIIKG
ncbi:Ppx/GppA phosphatase family protein [Shivajiella indica]|uniref:Ppx/GppA phosphatase family protein n=1 Tax=Shivajiella indica TaxID=872115 RepID=A0ABW5BAL2_9BACT